MGFIHVVRPLWSRLVWLAMTSQYALARVCKSMYPQRQALTGHVGQLVAACSLAGNRTAETPVKAPGAGAGVGAGNAAKTCIESGTHFANVLENEGNCPWPKAVPQSQRWNGWIRRRLFHGDKTQRNSGAASSFSFSFSGTPRGFDLETPIYGVDLMYAPLLIAEGLARQWIASR